MAAREAVALVAEGVGEAVVSVAAAAGTLALRQAPWVVPWEAEDRVAEDGRAGDTGDQKAAQQAAMREE